MNYFALQGGFLGRGKGYTLGRGKRGLFGPFSHELEPGGLAASYATDTAAFSLCLRRVQTQRMYERQKKAATGFADRDLSGAHFEHRKTAEKIASLAGVGQATVRRAAEFAKTVLGRRDLSGAQNEPGDKSHATARKIAAVAGVDEKTVRFNFCSK